MNAYYRPVPSLDPSRPANALCLANGPAWFDSLERLERGRPSEFVPLAEVPGEVLDILSGPRPPVEGLALDRPHLMGILNITPDSFSDGGRFDTLRKAVAHGRTLVRNGADILDIGGESTRPGASEVPIAEEIERTAPVIEILARDIETPISIDTRKAEVARMALGAGARIVNDVSGLSFDSNLAGLAAEADVPVVLMHSLGSPENMQDDPRYNDVLLDVYDALAARIETALAAGICRSRIVIDPGIGFGKTLEHNLALLARLSLFHGLGCALLLGVSRKRFIGTIGNAPNPVDRVPGSLAAALAALRQGVQILRVHDIVATKQALALYLAATGAPASDERRGRGLE